MTLRRSTVEHGGIHTRLRVGPPLSAARGVSSPEMRRGTVGKPNRRTMRHGDKMNAERKEARRRLTTAIAKAIDRELEEIAGGETRQASLEEDRLAVMGWSSNRLIRLAARAAVAVLEGGREGERLRGEFGGGN